MRKRSNIKTEELEKIHQMYDDGVPPDKIVEEFSENIYEKTLNRALAAYKQSKVIEKGKEATANLEKVNTFHKIEADEIQEIAEPPSPDIDEEGWKEAAEDAIDKIMTYNVDEDRAVQLVKDAMDKVDLTQDPDMESITSFVFQKANELLKRHDNNGQSVVSMTGAASLASENVVKKKGATKYEDGIFRPNAPKRTRFM